MNRIVNLSILLAALFLASGCASYQIRPPVASIALPKPSRPIPATLGIMKADEKASGGFAALAPTFKKHLDESALFQTVYYPTRPGDQMDGGIDLTIRAGFKMDPVWFPKAFFTGFFMLLPAPITSYNHKYETECTLELVRNGK
jgi:hypothetical protein